MKYNSVNIEMNRDYDLNLLKIKNISSLMKHAKISPEVIILEDVIPDNIGVDLYEGKGWGLKSKKNIKKGDIIYILPLRSFPENKILVKSYLGEKYIDKEEHLSSLSKAHNIFPSWDCFLNHDDSNNADYHVNLIIKKGDCYCRLLAVKDIKKGEEITLNYNRGNCNMYMYFFNCFLCL